MKKLYHSGKDIRIVIRQNTSKDRFYIELIDPNHSNLEWYHEERTERREKREEKREKRKEKREKIQANNRSEE